MSYPISQNYIPIIPGKRPGENTTVSWLLDHHSINLSLADPHNQPSATNNQSQSIHMFVGQIPHDHGDITIISHLNVRSTILLFSYVCMFLVSTSLNHSLSQYLIYITILSTCSQYTILTTSLVPPGLDLPHSWMICTWDIDQPYPTLPNPSQPLSYYHNFVGFLVIKRKLLEREREREIDRYIYIYVCTCEYIHTTPVNPNATSIKHVTCHHAALSADAASRQHLQTP